jgi:hypothetical protein
MLAEANRDSARKVFDWMKLVALIKEHQPDVVVAGLSTDMEWTSGIVYKKDKIVDDSYVFLSSNWATPVAELDGEEYDCYVMEDESEYTSGTNWPDDARKALED